MLAVALHGQLLEVGRESIQVLFIRQDRDGLGVEEVGVPDGQEAHEHRQVALERGGAEVLVHLMKAVEQGTEVLGSDGQHGRETNRRVHGIAPADPVPELEHVGRVDTELGHLRGIRRDRDEVPSHGPGIAAEALEQPVARGCARSSSFPVS